MKTALLVLGSHRSGTSPVTRVLSLLGADLPTRLMPPADENVLGFWEPADVVGIHREILAAAGTSWDDWRRFDPAWYESPLAKAYQDRLLAWLARDFGGSALFVIKDPRMCRLVRLWRDALSAFDARITVVIPVRNPVEVARSLQKRNGLAPAKSYLLWLRHVLDAVSDTRDVPRCVVSYAALLGDWRKTAIEIAQRLEVTWPRPISAAESEIDQFISARERHHVVDDHAWLDGSEIGDWVKRAYRELVAMTASGDTDPAQAALDAVAADFDTAIAAFGPLLEERKEEGRLIGELEARDQRLIAADREMRRLIGEAEEREGKLVEAGRHVRRLITDVEARDRRLVEVDGERHRLMRKAAERARQADSDVRQSIAEAQERDQRLIVADRELRRLIVEVGERDQRLMAADGELRRLIGEVGERDQRLTAAEGELRRLMRDAAERARQADSDVRQWIAEVQARDQRLMAADLEVRRLIGEVEEREGRLVAADGELRRLIATVGERDQRLIAVDGELRRLIAEVEERDQRLGATDDDMRRLLRAVARRDEDLATVEARLAAAVDALHTAGEALHDRDQRLAVVERRLHAIETSRSWRMISALRDIVRRRS